MMSLLNPYEFKHEFKYNLMYGVVIEQKTYFAFILSNNSFISANINQISL